MRVKLVVPKSLKEIKLSQYQKFIRTTKDKEDLHFIHKQMVAIFCNLSDDLTNKIAKKDFDRVVIHLSKILEEKYQLTHTLSFKGIDYGFIPDLENITVGEAADLDMHLKDVKDYHKAMSILYRKITSKKGDKYLIEDYTSKEESLDLPMHIVIGATVFFYSLMKDLLNCTQSYIEAQLENTPNLKEHLAENGVGIQTSMELLEETFLNLRKLAS